MIRYHEIPPHPALSGYLKCLWFMEREDDTHESEEYIWPDGYVELLIHFGNYSVKAREQPSRKLACSFVVGPLTQSIQLSSSGSLRVIGARFLPWGFCSFFHTPMYDLRDQLVPFSDLAGRRAHLLEKRCCELPLEEAVYALQDDLLTSLSTPLLEPDRHVLEAIHALHASTEQVAIKDITLHSGLSLRHLERRFQEWVGVTPKKLSSIRRFNLARQAIIARPAIDLTSLAHQMGYYDYAHFSNDFKTYLGLTPPTFKRWLLSLQASSPQRDVVFFQDMPDLLW